MRWSGRKEVEWKEGGGGVEGRMRWSGRKEEVEWKEGGSGVEGRRRWSCGVEGGGVVEWKEVEL